MQAPRKANVRYFSTRAKPGKRKSTPLQIVSLRLVDLATIFRARWGNTLPDDDAGRDDIALAVDHLAALAHPRKAIRNWLELWAPWLTLAEQRSIIARGMVDRRNWTADKLAWRLHLTREDRAMLGITTIGAIDHAKAARTKRRKERERQRKAAQRRAKGAKPRAEYLAEAASRARPWEDEGISRRTWYRRKRDTPVTLPDGTTAVTA